MSGYLALVLLAVTTPSPDVHIVGPSEVEAGNLVTLHASAPEGADLAWKVHPPEASARMYVDTQKRTVCFASRTEGVYVFSLAASHEGKAYCEIHELRNGTPPEPEPEPDPEPDPDPEPGKRFVMVVIESHNRTPESAAVLMGIRDYCEKKGHPYRFVDPDIVNKDGETPEWFEAYGEDLDQVAEGPTLLVGVLESDTQVSTTWVSELPETPEAAIEVIQNKGG